MKEKKINLLGTEYTIKIVDRISNDNELFYNSNSYDHNNNNDSFIEGECNNAERCLTIATRKINGDFLSEFDFKKNLWHELVHSFLSEGQYLDSNRDEPLVEWLARCIVSVISQGVCDIDNCETNNTVGDEVE